MRPILNIFAIFTVALCFSNIYSDEELPSFIEVEQHLDEHIYHELEPQQLEEQAPPQETFQETPQVQDDIRYLQDIREAIYRQEVKEKKAESPPVETSIEDPKPKKVTIGIVREGYSRVFEPLIEQVKKELAELNSDEFEVFFKFDPSFDAKGRINRLNDALEAALNDEEVDMIYTSSILITLIAAQREKPLNKPVVSAYLQKADFFNKIFSAEGQTSAGESLIPNLSYISVPNGTLRDLQEFKGLIHFSKVHILVDDIIFQVFPDLVNKGQELGRQIDAEIIFVPVSSKEQILVELGDDVQAVYLASLYRLSESDYQGLIQGLIQKKIPTFSLLGYVDVYKGVLAGLTPDILTRTARRAALNIEQIILGESPNKLPIPLNFNERLLVNVLTAQQIGLDLDLKTLFLVDKINEDKVHVGEVLSLRDAMERAMDFNVDLAIQDAVIDSAYEDQQILLHKMYPHLKLTSNYLHIDRFRAINSSGITAVEDVTVGFQITQMIFDDELITGYRIAGKQWEKDWFDRQQIILDVAERAGNSFLDMVLLKDLIAIQKTNFGLVLNNLDLASVRHKIGASGIEEVYRWETAEAQNRAEIIQQEALLGQAESVLNQVMGGVLIHWDPKSINFSNEMAHFFGEILLSVVNTESKIAKFRDFSVQFALGMDPTLQAFDRLIEAQTLKLRQTERYPVTPRIYAGFTLDHEIYQRTLLRPLNIPPIVPKDIRALLEGFIVKPRLRTPWSGFINLEIPIYDGGETKHKIRQAKADLEKIFESRKRVEQLIIQRVWNILYRIESSLPRIKLTKIAAQRATQNYNLVLENYKLGTASIVDMIDAQTQLLQRSQQEATALNEFLKDLVSYQRSISWFYDFQTEKEKEEWLSLVKKFLTSACRR